jgi:hypothetical protein
MTTRARQRRGPHWLGSGRRLAWLLALALLLPFAQAVAWAHSLSHLSTAAQRADSGVAGSLDGPCVACLAAAALHAGALPAAPPIVVEPPLLHAQPVVWRRVAHRHDNRLAYRSRAPPLSLG